MLKNNLLLIFLITFILSVSSLPAWGDSTNDDNDQTNTSGSNTQITGGYTATTTNNNDGQMIIIKPIPMMMHRICLVVTS